MNRPPLGTLYGRALRLKCPHCGQAPMFSGWFRMHARCAACQLKFERASGYFLGSTYINYGLTSLFVTVAYVGLHFGAGIENRLLMPSLMAFVVLFPLVFFRFARALWLAMDCYWDWQGVESESRPLPSPPSNS